MGQSRAELADDDRARQTLDLALGAVQLPLRPQLVGDVFADAQQAVIGAVAVSQGHRRPDKVALFPRRRLEWELDTLARGLCGNPGDPPFDVRRLGARRETGGRPAEELRLR